MNEAVSIDALCRPRKAKSDKKGRTTPGMTARFVTFDPNAFGARKLQPEKGAEHV
ncbi:MAG: hypothetical protein ACETWE_10175 [Candidatus Bathyarchaeia archaeon]